MFRNYLFTAYRNLTRAKTNAVINIAGLSTGLAVTILIGLWIWDELSFDKGFDHYSRIVQVMQTETHNGKTSTGKGNVIPLAAELRKSYGNDFKYVVLSSWTMNSLVAAGDKKINTQGNYMEPDAPEMLSLKMLSGTRKGFKTATTLLLSRSMATALFGQTDPTGKTVTINGDLQENVTGVYEDFPANSSFKEVQFIAPFREK